MASADRKRAAASTSLVARALSALERTRRGKPRKDRGSFSGVSPVFGRNREQPSRSRRRKTRRNGGIGTVGRRIRGAPATGVLASQGRGAAATGTGGLREPSGSCRLSIVRRALLIFNRRAIASSS